MHHRPAHIPIWRGPFLSWGSLFPNDSGSYQVDFQMKTHVLEDQKIDTKVKFNYFISKEKNLSCFCFILCSYYFSLIRKICHLIMWLFGHILFFTQFLFIFKLSMSQLKSINLHFNYGKKRKVKLNTEFYHAKTWERLINLMYITL